MFFVWRLKQCCSHALDSSSFQLQSLLCFFYTSYSFNVIILILLDIQLVLIILVLWNCGSHSEVWVNIKLSKWIWRGWILKFYTSLLQIYLHICPCLFLKSRYLFGTSSCIVILMFDYLFFYEEFDDWFSFCSIQMMLCNWIEYYGGTFSIKILSLPKT